MKSLVAHAGQSYISEKDMEKMMNVIDVSNWSPRMREPMEAIYGKVLEPENIYVEMLGYIYVKCSTYKSNISKLIF